MSNATMIDSERGTEVLQGKLFVLIAHLALAVLAILKHLGTTELKARMDGIRIWGTDCGVLMGLAECPDCGDEVELYMTAISRKRARCRKCHHTSDDGFSLEFD